MKTKALKKAFTLTEILVVLVIMGFLVALVMPSFRGTISDTKASLNKSQMLQIKKASLDFYNDVGFVADNVSLLIYPWENCISTTGGCTVEEINFDKTDKCSDACINMIAFIDKHYKFTTDSPELRVASIGDNGSDTQRTDKLKDIIKEKLDPNLGWKGSYIGGNEIIRNKNLMSFGGTGQESANKYFFSNHDVKVYDADQYTDLNSMYPTKWTSATIANAELYPIFAESFNSMNLLYENAKYSKDTNGGSYSRETTFLGSMTLLDSYGTPYEIQIPTASAVTQYNTDNPNTSTVRTSYARIVSFGKDRRRDTPIDVLDIENYLNTAGNEKLKRDYDDSVLYIFGKHSLSNYFHPEDEDK